VLARASTRRRSPARRRGSVCIQRGTGTGIILLSTPGSRTSFGFDWALGATFALGFVRGLAPLGSCICPRQSAGERPSQAKDLSALRPARSRVPVRVFGEKRKIQCFTALSQGRRLTAFAAFEQSVGCDADGLLQSDGAPSPIALGPPVNQNSSLVPAIRHRVVLVSPPTALCYAKCLGTLSLPLVGFGSFPDVLASRLCLLGTNSGKTRKLRSGCGFASFSSSPKKTQKENSPAPLYMQDFLGACNH